MNQLKHCIALFALVVVASLVSCTKEVEKDVVGDSQGTFISFEADAPFSPETKMEATYGTSRYNFTWQAGDKISMIAYEEPTAANVSSSSKVVNFSANQFNANSDGASTTFSGWVPTLSGTLSGTQKIYAIYPASNLTVSDKSFYNSGSGRYYYKITGPAIADVQDGTGWPYCYFAASNGTINAATGQIETAPSFVLSNALIKFSYTSSKAISKIEVTADSDGSSQPGLTGNFTLYSLSGFSTIYEGCFGRSVTIQRATPFPSGTQEILFACRKIATGRTLTFTFTATDGTVAVRRMRANSEYTPNKVWKLPSLSLTNWFSAQLAQEATVQMGMGVSVGGLETVTATTETIPERADQYGMHILDRTQPETYETNAARDRITQTTMDALYAAGFRSARIPITWYNHMGAPVSDDGVIDAVWLNHIQSVVNMARNAGMYVIINVHHDAGSSESLWLKADWANYTTISAQFKSIWTQIATHFKSYDCHLLFEGYNEITDETGSWFTPSSANGYKAANALNQVFVDAVRATGGNNAVRNLIVSTYTASDRTDAMQNFQMPLDLSSGHLLVQVHSYLPVSFVTAREVGDNSRLEFYESEKAEIDAMFSRLQTNILDKGWPCILGEYGAFSKKNSAGNRNELGRAEHAYYYTTRALQRGIVPLYWYNPMDYRDRDTGNWTYPILAQGLMDAWADYTNNTVVYKKYNHDDYYPIPTL